MNARDIGTLGLMAGLAYAIYKLAPGFSKATNATADVIANFYTWATLPPAMVVQGNLSFADGSLVPLSMVDVRQQGNLVVASYAGHFYQLSPSDASGNWPAMLIQ